jgi:hypothetical protein
VAERPERRARQGPGRPWLTALSIAALGLVAVWPLFREPALVCTDDLGFHLLRLTQLDHLLQNGILYSRWAPDMALGYGFPFFNFYAPLAYYLAAGLSALGGGLNLGIRLAFALGIIGSGLAVYRLARDHFSQPASFVAATAVMFAPYHGYDVYFRGNLAEALAWPFMALALWAMGRLERRGRSWLPIAALATAAVLLTHNVFALIFLPLLALHGVAEGWLGEAAGDGAVRPWRRLGVVAAALALGLGLSAFFWLPAMVEQRTVHIDRLLVPPVFVYWNNFASPGELFALPHAILPDLLNPSPPRGLGLMPVLLALPALWGWWRWRDSRRRQVAFFGAALLAYVFLMTAASEPIWEAVPLLQFVQFPWRLLGPAAICLAMLLAAAVDVLAGARRRLAMLVAGMSIVLLVLASLFWFDPRYCGGLEEPTVEDLAAFELATDTIGTTAKGEYLPRTVTLYPPEPAPAPPRFAEETLPAGVRLLEQEDGPLRATALLEATAPVQIVANVFAYPGWRAWVDGKEVAVTPEEGYGRVMLPLPAGRHEVVVAFGETAQRRAADLVSGVSLLAVLALAILLWRRRGTPGDERDASRSDGAWQAAFLLLGLVLFALVAGLLPRLSTPLAHHALQNGAMPDLQSPQSISFQGGLRLLGFGSDDGAELPADSARRYDLFWTATISPAASYQSTVQLVGQDGQLWSAKDSSRPRDFRDAPDTATWAPGQVAQDSHLLQPLPGTPPGVYDVELVLFDLGSLLPAPALGGQGQAIRLDTVTVERPRRPATVEELGPQHTAGTDRGPLRLLGFNLDRAEATPGEPFLLTLFWQALEEPQAAYTLRLTLLGPDGDAVLTRSLPAASAAYPTTAWRAGDTWRGQHPLRLPAGLESGRHQWQLELCRGEGECEPAGEPLLLGDLVIQAPERRFEAPAFSHPVGERLGDAATLLGADLQPDALAPGAALDVTLVWRAEQEMESSYRVFVHLRGPAGDVVVQSDGEPANWTRPTTGWLPGEIIVDGRRLALPAELPAGDYRLVAGLYDPQSGERLSLANGEDAALVTTFQVRP